MCLYRKIDVMRPYISTVSGSYVLLFHINGFMFDLMYNVT